MMKFEFFSDAHCRVRGILRGVLNVVSDNRTASGSGKSLDLPARIPSIMPLNLGIVFSTVLVIMATRRKLAKASIVL